MPAKRKGRAGAKKSKKSPDTAPPKAYVPLKYTPGYYPTRGIFEDPKLGRAAMEADFEAMGMSPETIDTLMAIKERPVDACTQTTHGTFAREKEAKAKRLEEFIRKKTRRQTQSKSLKGKQDAADKKKGRQQITLKGDWVLYDITRGPPPTGGDFPKVFARYTTYEPGNTRVVAYNVKSSNCILRRVPDEFEGHTVQYLKAGPKLVDIKQKGRKAS